MSRVKYEVDYTGTANEVPAGGTTGQVLRKASDANYDAEWGTFTGIGTTFVSLGDTPADYVGQTGKTIVVNATEDGLEFGTGGSGSGGLTESIELGEDLLTNDFVKIIEGKAYKRNKTMGYSTYSDNITNNLGVYGLGISYGADIDDTHQFIILKDNTNIHGFGANHFVGGVATLDPVTNTVTLGTMIDLTGADNVTSLYYMKKMTDNRFMFFYGVAGSKLQAVLIGISGTTSSILDSQQLHYNSGSEMYFTKYTDTSGLWTGRTDLGLSKILVDITGDVITSSTIAATTTTYDTTNEVPSVLTETDYIVGVGYVTGTGLVATTFNKTGATTLVETGQVTVFGDTLGTIRIVDVLFDNNVLVVIVYEITNAKISYIPIRYLPSTHLVEASTAKEVTLIDGINEAHFEDWSIEYIDDNMYAMTTTNYLKEELVLNYFKFDTTCMDVLSIYGDSSTVLCQGSVSVNRPTSYGISKVGDHLVVLAGDDDNVAGYDIQYDVVKLDRYSPLKRGTKYGYMTEGGLATESKTVGILGVD